MQDLPNNYRYFFFGKLYRDQSRAASPHVPAHRRGLPRPWAGTGGAARRQDMAAGACDTQF
jgi:hypothetical protein